MSKSNGEFGISCGYGDEHTIVCPDAINFTRNRRTGRVTVTAELSKDKYDALTKNPEENNECRCSGDHKHHHHAEHLCKCHRAFLARQTRALEEIAAALERKHQSPIIDADAEQAKKENIVPGRTRLFNEPVSPLDLEPLKPGEYEATIDDVRMPSHDCLVIDYRIGSRVISKRI